MTNITADQYKEKRTLIRLLTVITALLLFDIGADIFYDLYAEVFYDVSVLVDITTESVTLVCVLWAAYIASRMLKRELASSKQLRQNLLATTKDASILREKVKNYVLDFQKQLQEQLDNWHLSKSEKEIAVLLLKGKSSKEIATIRNTSEKTIRNQCQSIYAKSGLSGRNELVSYFFTELLHDIDLEDVSESAAHIYAKQDHQDAAYL